MKSTTETFWEPKVYRHNGLTLEWGQNISAHNMEQLRSGEVFVLLDAERNPYSEVLMDSYNQIREERIDGTAH